MTLQSLDIHKSYTYADYLKWTFDETVELIKGHLFPMAAPSTNHQQIVLRLISKMDRYLEEKPCQLFIAPFDVRFPKPLAQRKTSKDIETVVQPDLCVICDLAKIDRKGCLGAPDWIIEILSKSTAQKDQRDKFAVYQESGVREYWIVNIDYKSIVINHLQADGRYQTQNIKTIGDTVNSFVFPDFSLAVEDIFKGLLEFEEE